MRSGSGAPSSASTRNGNVHLGAIAATMGVAEDHARALLGSLQRRDLVGLEPATTVIRYAYPFSRVATGHRVLLGGQSLDALCAVDALGAGACRGADIEIESLCRPCGEPLRVATADESRDVRGATPGGVVVQYAFDDEGSAATSYCQSTAFCTGELLRRCLYGQAASRDGLALSLDEALEVGRAVFGPRPGALDASVGRVARPSEVVRRAPGKGRRRASGACSLLSRRREKVPSNSVLHRPLGLLNGPGHRDRLALRSGTPAWLLGNRIGDKGCPRFRSNVRSGSGTQLAHLLIPKPG